MRANGTLVVGPEGVILFTSTDLGFGRDKPKGGGEEIEVKADREGNCVSLQYPERSGDRLSLTPEQARMVAYRLLQNAEDVENGRVDT